MILRVASVDQTIFKTAAGAVADAPAGMAPNPVKSQYGKLRRRLRGLGPNPQIEKQIADLEKQYPDLNPQAPVEPTLPSVPMGVSPKTPDDNSFGAGLPAPEDPNAFGGGLGLEQADLPQQNQNAPTAPASNDPGQAANAGPGLGGWDGMMDIFKQFATKHNSQTQEINPAYKTLRELHKGVQNGQYDGSAPSVVGAVEKLTYWLQDKMQDEVQDAQTLMQLAPMVTNLATDMSQQVGISTNTSLPGNAPADIPGRAAPARNIPGRPKSPEGGFGEGLQQKQPGMWQKGKDWLKNKGQEIGQSLRPPNPPLRSAEDGRPILTASMGSAEYLLGDVS